MFWIIGFGLIVCVGVPMLRALLRGDAETATPAQQDVAVYKDQIAEVDRDLARGLLDPADADAARTEVARRLLSADKRASTEKDSLTFASGPRWLGVGVVFAALVGAVGLYFTLGVPGMRDLPLQSRLAAAQEARENRPNQLAAEEVAPKLPVEADPEHAELVETIACGRSKQPARPDRSAPACEQRGTVGQSDCRTNRPAATDGRSG